MDEYFLQFLWKFQKFQTLPLILTNGEVLSVFHPGQQNDHSGPDFLEAKIKIGNITWSGSVEVHYKSSDWQRHGHHQDQAYENVVLHVVWIHDEEVLQNHQALPTLALQYYTNTDLQSTYLSYINQPGDILCGCYLRDVFDIHIHAMIDRSIAARLQEKSKSVTGILEETNNDWEEVTYRILAKNFGFKVNTTPFETLAKSLPYRIIRKHAGNEISIFALVYGMSGLLNEINDEYTQALYDEFVYLKKKYRLEVPLERHQWKFAKMRPANFPTVRLAQFAALLNHSTQLFHKIISIKDVKSATELVKQEIPTYWQNHYDFCKTSKRRLQIGETSITTIIINSVVPILVAYSKYLDDVSLLEKAYCILENLPTEKNKIIRIWEENQIYPKNAAESQALLYQHKNYCIKKKCLQCNIGLHVLNITK